MKDCDDVVTGLKPKSCIKNLLELDEYDNLLAISQKYKLSLLLFLLTFSKLLFQK